MLVIHSNRFTQEIVDVGGLLIAHPNPEKDNVVVYYFFLIEIIKG
jgi:hypothetical protein